jgi:asparaginyl-tRNA synthetase
VLKKVVRVVTFPSTHIEAERSFITFEDLLQSIEDLIVDVATRIAHGLFREELFFVRPDFTVLHFLFSINYLLTTMMQIPKKPFKRMDYAIKYCREHDIYKKSN